MTVLGSTRDPEGRLVELTEERWTHVVKVGHPEMDGLVGEVMAVVASPDKRVDGRAPNEVWFYRRGVGPSRWLKVVVIFEGDRGFIVTAHPRRSFP